VLLARCTPLAQLNARLPLRRTATALLSVCLVAASFAAAFASRPAAGDSISSLKSQALAISQKIVLEQLQIGAYQQQYSVYSQKVANDQADVADIDQQIATDQRAIQTKSLVVRRTAVMTYTSAGAASTDTSVTLFTGNANRAQAAGEYSGIAVGNITTALDQLHTARLILETDQQALQRKQAQDQTDLSQQSNDLSQAHSSEQQLATTQSVVNGQLAAAVAQAQAAQRALAAAAVAAAERAATKAHPNPPPSTTVPTVPPSSATVAAGAQAPAPTSTTTTPAPPALSAGAGGGPNLTDPPLPPFLQCVVEAESGGNYGAVSPNGEYMGAFQFSQPTWDSAAGAAGLGWLVGVPPNQASKAAQDTVAVALYALDGQQPWLGDRCAG
jgi:peptidoglycan hydrolase CwlO-like protein